MKGRPRMTGSEISWIKTNGVLKQTLSWQTCALGISNFNFSGEELAVLSISLDL